MESVALLVPKASSLMTNKESALNVQQTVPFAPVLILALNAPGLTL